jgi:hypothetical protein
MLTLKDSFLRTKGVWNIKSTSIEGFSLLECENKGICFSLQMKTTDALLIGFLLSNIEKIQKMFVELKEYIDKNKMEYPELDQFLEQLTSLL